MESIDVEELLADKQSHSTYADVCGWTEVEAMESNVFDGFLERLGTVLSKDDK